MMSEMMKLCCGDDGMPSFEKMKQFMEQCGKKGFTEEHMAMMKAFLRRKRHPGFRKDEGHDGEMRMPHSGF